MWLQIRSYLIARSSLEEFLTWADGKDWMGRWMPEGPEMHDVYLGEWPWHSAAHGVEGGWRETTRSDVPTPVLPTSASYSWSSEGDNSLTWSASAILPERQLSEWLQVRWKPEHFEWANDGGEIVASDPSGTQKGPSVLLVRSEAVRRVLDEQDLALVWTVLGEKLVIGDHTHSSPRMTINGVGALESGAATIAINVRSHVD
jgi:hypothetical protein